MTRKETIVEAILALHLQRAIARYPQPVTDMAEAEIKGFVESYRPLAEEEANAITEALSK